MTVANPTLYNVEVEVRTATLGAWMILGDVAAQSRADFEAVIDHGSDWEFRIAANGDATARFAATRAMLNAHHWTISIPPSIQRLLTTRGAVIVTP